MHERQTRNSARPICVYTSIVGGYDWHLRQPHFSNTRHICFSDRRVGEVVNGWEIRALEHPCHLVSPSDINRYHKLFAYRQFQGHQFAIYIDGNIILKANPHLLADAVAKSGHPIGAFHHPTRSTVREEFEACVDHGKLTDALIGQGRAFLDDQAAAGFGDECGLSWNAILIRDTGDPELQEAMETWWAHIASRSPRDQLSLQYALWSHGLGWHPLDQDIAPKAAFRRKPHRADSHEVLGLRFKKKRFAWLKRLARG